MFKSSPLQFAVALTLLAAGSLTSQAQDAGALVDKLVKKGVLSSQEGEEVRADMMRDFATQTPAGKINLNSSITELKLYGDLRLRYQYDNKDDQRPRADSTPAGGNRNDSQRSRYRFRLRLNADFKLGDSFFGGVELASAQASDSGNQTFQDGFSDYSIFISKAYLGWNVTDYATVLAGKFGNPFYTTDLVWDNDINPTGLVQSIAFHKMHFGGGATAAAGYSKDGKSHAPAEVLAVPNWELTLNAGQFIYDDNPESAFDNDSSTDAFIFQTQLVAAYKFNNGVKFTIAPGWFYTNAAAYSGFENENSFVDAGAGTNVKAISGAGREMNVLLLPGDVSFMLGGVKTKFLWDLAWNLNGEDRANNILSLTSVDANGNVASQHSDEDDFAFLVGVQLGENKKQGDWSVLANYRQTGIAAVDPNLNDSDFALGEMNTRGFKLSLAYNFTDFAVGAVTYFYAWNLRDDLTAGQSTFGQSIGDSNVIQVLQVDFSIKF